MAKACWLRQMCSSELAYGVAHATRTRTSVPEPTVMTVELRAPKDVLTKSRTASSPGRWVNCVQTGNPCER